ncbi:DUF2927 domain-containing protein [Paracoccus sediminicola]|uniref:DUF2927 domain-containing protein n=1 Tax=Paracoccus sediminicola TaxID=3017783 RepID=UPI0022F04141|nr:DUF2927 domain-containing protein [Paracoccus sediminicola]WBU58209.1 DUF2927 domain-containing protein [Paracoccus sediminicola]
MLGALALAGCDQREVEAPAPAPEPVVAPAPRIASAPPVPRPSSALRAARAKRAALQAEVASEAQNTQASQTMHGYFEGVEDMLTARGQLRRDDGAEIPLSVDQLTRDFVDIALFDEYTRNGAELVAGAQPSRLRRWAQPVRISVEFGDSVPPATRTRDRAQVHGFAERLAEVTGHDIEVTPGRGNFTVMYLNEDERRAIGPRLEEVVPGIPEADIEAIQALPAQNYCTVFAYSIGSSPLYSEAVAIIRAELPPRLRNSCVHEELAQGMGLANDSPDARPSIFNDDEEYALLTRHDALLLQMLYDDRMKPGMTAKTAEPIAREIAAELLE